MGAGESRQTTKDLLRGKKALTSSELESMWSSFGDNEKLPREDAIKFFGRLAKQMDIHLSNSEVADLVEKCRSAQGKYADNMISYYHFKRLYIALASKTHEIQLSDSIMALVPTIDKNIFGAEMDEATINSDPLGRVPKPVQDVCEYLCAPEHITSVGLYRIPGSESTIQKAIQQYDLGEAVEFDHESDAAGVLVKFLIYSPNGVFSSPDIIRDLYQAKNAETEYERITNIHQVLKRLPSANRECLRVICQHLLIVMQNEEQNKMGFDNLSACIGSHFVPIFWELVHYADKGLIPSTLKYTVSFQLAADRSNYLIPSPVHLLILHLSAYGLHDDNLYLSQGDELQTNRIVYELNNDVERDLTAYNKHSVAQALRRFFANTTDSLWAGHENEIVQAISNADFQAAQLILNSLPLVHRLCIIALTEHLRIIVKNSNLSTSDICFRLPICRINEILPYLTAQKIVISGK